MTTMVESPYHKYEYFLNPNYAEGFDVGGFFKTSYAARKMAEKLLAEQVEVFGEVCYGYTICQVVGRVGPLTP